MVHAGDVMVRPVVSVRCSTPLREAGTVLAEYGYAGLPVVDESGCLLGFLTAGDVLRAARRREATAMTAMSVPAIAVDMHSDLDEIGRVLVRRGIRSVPVVDDERRVIGIISRGDLLRLDLTSDDVIALGTQKMLDGYTGKRRWIAQVRQGQVLVAGHFDSDAERRIATALVRTVPGVREVRIGAATPSTD